MIELHPEPDIDFNCPICDQALSVEDWYIPGMRMVASLRCSGCTREFFGDLPIGHGLVYPSLINAETGAVHNEFGGDWFANWLVESYANRKDDPLTINKTQETSIDQPLVLNCLDALYGHSLLKLLNAQYCIDEITDYDLFILVPSNLEWLVPDGVPAVWSIDLPFDRGTEWNEWLDNEIKSFLSKYDHVFGHVAFPHPHPGDYDIFRFSGIDPFSLDSWSEQNPTVTYIWRDDRLWAPTRLSSRFVRRVRGTIYRGAEKIGWNPALYEQRRNIEKLEGCLRSDFPDLDFAVAGIGESGGLSGSINDLRKTSPKTKEERNLCRRYARSHVVVGVHGSNMLLPSAHAGGVVELVPPTRWSNITQDFLFEQDSNVQEANFGYQQVPTSTSPKRVATITESILKNRLHQSLLMRGARNQEGAFEPKQFKYKWAKSTFRAKNDEIK